jgi:hypothetical protein
MRFLPNLSCHAKIAQFRHILLIDNNILCLHIAMHTSSCMQVFQGANLMEAKIKNKKQNENK